MKKIYSPDADPGTATAPSSPQTTSSKPSIPSADIDFGDLALTAANAWTANEQITLVWMTSANFVTLAGSYQTSLTQRREIGVLRPQQTNILNNLDAQADDALGEVKSYIANKYTTKNAASYYPQFGMVHRGSRWILPADRQERSDALQLMIEAINTRGFNTNGCGTDFWTSLKTAYDNALSETTGIDSGVSNRVGSKNQLKQQIRKVLKALRLVLQANYPDTFQQVLREWGFQKEDF